MKRLFIRKTQLRFILSLLLLSMRCTEFLRSSAQIALKEPGKEVRKIIPNFDNYTRRKHSLFFIRLPLSFHMRLLKILYWSYFSYQQRKLFTLICSLCNCHNLYFSIQPLSVHTADTNRRAISRNGSYHKSKALFSSDLFLLVLFAKRCHYQRLVKGGNSSEWQVLTAQITSLSQLDLRANEKFWS